MNDKKLRSPLEVAERTTGYTDYIEQHRGTLKDLGGNSKVTLAALDDEARQIKKLVEHMDEQERAFLAARSEVKARATRLNEALTEQLNYAREYAKRHHLPQVRAELRSYSQGNGRKRSKKTDDAATKPTS